MSKLTISPKRRLSPLAYLKLEKTNRELIGSTKIIPPKFGKKGVGYIEVEILSSACHGKR